MKAALIASPYPLAEFPAPPLGLCYAAAAFESAGCEVRILDYIVRGFTPEKLRSELEDFAPDIIGTNSVTLNFNAAADILTLAKSFAPEALVVMGGPHVSFDYQNTLIRYPAIDLIVSGEGEQTIRELVPAVRDRSSWKDIQGLAYRDGDQVRFTGRRPFIDDLDALPLPARRLLPLARYKALGFPVSIITSRGCPNQCIFCQGRRMVGNRVRYRDPVLVVDEIETILAMGFDRINVADDFFTASRKRVGRVCDEILRRGIRFGWSAFARVDSVDRALLETMKAAGCDALLFGIESGNQDILNRIRKHIRLDQIRNAVAECRAAGMNAFGSFIAGLPGETLDTMKETHAFAISLGIDFGYHFLAPFPGTPVMEEMNSFGLELLTDDWSRFDANRPVTRTQALTAEEVEHFINVNYMGPVKIEEEKMLRRCRENTCTEFERLICLGRKKNNIVFNLLANDLIERYGRLPESRNGDDGALELIAAVRPFVDGDPDVLEFVIRDIIAKGYLERISSAAGVAWSWARTAAPAAGHPVRPQ